MRISILLAASVLAGAGFPAHAQPGGYDAQRGRLLYDTQCHACHSAQAHWRDKRLVRSWGELLREVARWEKTAGQHWSAQDIGDTAAYLNAVYYRLPCDPPGCEGDAKRTRAAIP